MFKMQHYVTRTPDGLIHVQNAVMGMLGQHHVHTQEDFERWSAKSDPAAFEVLPTQDGQCDCGLAAGEMKSR